MLDIIRVKPEGTYRAGVDVIVLAAILLTGCPAPGSAQDVRAVLDVDSLQWQDWESLGTSNRSAVLDSLGFRVDAEHRLVSAFHFVDLTGDGTAEVIYAGWNADFDSTGTLRMGEGLLLQIYQHDSRNPVLVYGTIGRIARLWRPEPTSPLWLRVQHDGCCGDDRLFTEDLSPHLNGGRLAYQTAQVFLTPFVVVRPTKLLRTTMAFVVENDGYRLRSSPEINDAPGESQWGPARGNVLAEYGRDAEGIALGESVDQSGRVWWFVVMNPSTPPRNALHRDDTEKGRPAAARAGWMSSRFVRVTDQGRTVFR